SRSATGSISRATNSRAAWAKSLRSSLSASGTSTSSGRWSSKRKAPPTGAVTRAGAAAPAGPAAGDGAASDTVTSARSPPVAAKRVMSARGDDTSEPREPDRQGGAQGDRERGRAGDAQRVAHRAPRQRRAQERVDAAGEQPADVAPQRHARVEREEQVQEEEHRHRPQQRGVGGRAPAQRVERQRRGHAEHAARGAYQQQDPA